MCLWIFFLVAACIQHVNAMVMNSRVMSCSRCSCPEESDPVCAMSHKKEDRTFMTFKNQCEFACNAVCNEAVIKFVYCGTCDDRPLAMKGTRPDPSELTCLRFTPKSGNGLDPGQPSIPTSPPGPDVPGASGEEDNSNGPSTLPGNTGSGEKPGDGDDSSGNGGSQEAGMAPGPPGKATSRPGTNPHKPSSGVTQPGRNVYKFKNPKFHKLLEEPVQNGLGFMSIPRGRSFRSNLTTLL